MTLTRLHLRHSEQEAPAQCCPEDNASKITAKETSLPYLYMLRQLHLAYLEAWRDLCQSERGKCPGLSDLQYFNHSISCRTLELEIPAESEEGTSTVSAVMSTVDDGITMVPKVIITQTVSTINLTEANTEQVSTTAVAVTVKGKGEEEEERDYEEDEVEEEEVITTT